MSKKPAPVDYIVDDQEILMAFYRKALWNHMVPRIPASIAPNTITVLGQVAALLAVAAAAFATAGNPFFYVVSCVLLLAYLTADNVDGPHARATGQSSPLGEFLDHGLDGVASAAVIIATVICLRVTGLPMVAFCILGAVGFILIFYEQFRTGRLVLPKFSAAEGVTFLMIIQLILAFGGDPTWLHFSMTEFTVATGIIGIVLVAYAFAMIPPIARVMKTGVRPWELLPVFAVALSPAGFVALGGDSFIPGIAAGLYGADMVCRMIVLRHQGRTGPILNPMHLLIVVPLIGAVAAPDAWTVTGWATVALIITIVLYMRTLFKGISGFLQRRAHAV